MSQRRAFSGLCVIVVALTTWSAVVHGTVLGPVLEGLPDRDEYYHRLKVEPTASQEEIDNSFRDLIQPLLPDMEGGVHTDKEEHARRWQEHKYQKQQQRKEQNLPPLTDATGGGPPIKIWKEPTEEFHLYSRAFAVLHDRRLRAAYDEGGHDAVQAYLKLIHPRRELSVHLPPVDADTKSKGYQIKSSGEEEAERIAEGIQFQEEHKETDRAVPRPRHAPPPRTATPRKQFSGSRSLPIHDHPPHRPPTEEEIASWSKSFNPQEFDDAL